MATLLLLTSSRPRREALLEQLVRLEHIQLVDTVEGADAVLLDNNVAAPPAAKRILKLESLRQPLRWVELARRLALLLDRSQAEQPFAVGPYLCLPLERLLIEADGAEHLRLTDKEVQLLQALSDAGEDGISRAELLEGVWGYREELETHTLETHIYRLRQKLEADPAAPQYLVTTEGGYALMEKS